MALLDSVRFVLEHPLNRGRGLDALLRIARWQLGTRAMGRRAVVDWVGGARFIAGRGETGLTGNIYCGLHEFADMAFVLHAIRPGDLFADVGANVGSYTLLACAARQARGHCFEPVPSTFARLVDNLRLNGLEGRVHAHNCGVGEASGALSFSSAHDCGNHVVAAGESGASVTVPVVTLDAALAGEAPVVIKLDVEGFEVPVLRGSREMLAAPGPRALVVELNGSGKRYGFEDRDVEGMLAQHGFGEMTYDPFARELRPPAAPRAPGNAIFVRDVAWFADRVKRSEPFEVFGRSI
jgi:FkbM family methyltransferase